MYLGELIEFGATDQIFIKPARKETEDYITGPLRLIAAAPSTAKDPR